MDSGSLLLGANSTDGFLRGPDEKTKRMLVLAQKQIWQVQIWVWGQSLGGVKVVVSRKPTHPS